MNNVSSKYRDIAFLLALIICVIVARTVPDIRRDEKDKSAPDSLLRTTNKTITVTSAELDSIRRALPQLIEDSLRRNEIFQYLSQNAARIDSMRTVNDELVGRAYEIARRNSLFSVPRRNATVFTEYKDFKGVKPLSWKYYANDKQIRAYDKVRSANPNLERSVRSHFDSIANAKISRLQNQMDSLLNKKYEMICDGRTK